MLMQLQIFLNYEFIKIQTQNETLVIYKQETFRKKSVILPHMSVMTQ